MNFGSIQEARPLPVDSRFPWTLVDSHDQDRLKYYFFNYLLCYYGIIMIVLSNRNIEVRETKILLDRI